MKIIQKKLKNEVWKLKFFNSLIKSIYILVICKKIGYGNINKMASAIEKIANNAENYDEIDEIYP
jgi:hypothetical protein